MQILKITPRGYCHGVVNAINLVIDAAYDESTPKPIYILGQIVHNDNLTNALNEIGVITLEGENRSQILGKVSSGTVIVTAHGIDKKLIKEAKEKGLNVKDATCVDVYKTHNIIEKKITNGYDVIYIGKHGHPEPEGVLGIDDKKIHLVEKEKEIEKLEIDNGLICITNQTTMSLYDVATLMEKAKNKYPHLESINEICSATSDRQIAVLDIANKCDLIIVVGDSKSNNSQKLKEIANTQNCQAILVNNLEELDISLLKDDFVIGVTSGASTPTPITKEIIIFLEQYKENDKQTHNIKSTITFEQIISRKGKKNGTNN